MTEEQVERVLMVALRRREEMAEEVATLILNAPIETFLPVASRAAFMEWDRITTLAEMNAAQFKRVEERDAEIASLKAREVELESKLQDHRFTVATELANRVRELEGQLAAATARLNATAADRMLTMIRGAA